MTPGDEYDSVVSISDVCPLIQVFGPGRGGGISKALYETSKHSGQIFQYFCCIDHTVDDTHVLCSRVRDADIDRGILVRGVRGHSFKCWSIKLGA